MAKRPLSSLSLGSTIAPAGSGSVPEAAPAMVSSPPPAAPHAPTAVTPVPTPIARPASPPSSSPELRTAMTYRPTVQNHERLRTHSFVTRRSMQDLVDEAVTEWLSKN